MNGLPKPKGEWWFCLALFLLGVVIMVSSVQIGFGRFTRPGAGLFPFFCGLILAAQSLALMFLGQTGQERDHLLKNPAEAKRFVAITAVFASIGLASADLFGDPGHLKNHVPGRLVQTAASGRCQYRIFLLSVWLSAADRPAKRVLGIGLQQGCRFHGI
jgi:hypothetical protein